MILKDQAIQFKMIGDLIKLLSTTLSQWYLINSIKKYTKKHKAILSLKQSDNLKNLAQSTDNLFIKKVHFNSKSSHSG